MTTPVAFHPKLYLTAILTNRRIASCDFSQLWTLCHAVIDKKSTHKYNSAGRSPYTYGLNTFIILPREDWMIYRGPSFLAVVWIGSTPAPSPLSRQLIGRLSKSSCVSLVQLTDGRRGGGRGAESYDRQKAWTSINRSILSGTVHLL